MVEGKSEAGGKHVEQSALSALLRSVPFPEVEQIEIVPLVLLLH